jgi:hypothetical protein
MLLPIGNGPVLHNVHTIAAAEAKPYAVSCFACAEGLPVVQAQVGNRQPERSEPASQRRREPACRFQVRIPSAGDRGLRSVRILLVSNDSDYCLPVPRAANGALKSGGSSNHHRHVRNGQLRPLN